MITRENLAIRSDRLDGDDAGRLTWRQFDLPAAVMTRRDIDGAAAQNLDAHCPSGGESLEAPALRRIKTACPRRG